MNSSRENRKKRNKSLHDNLAIWGEDGNLHRVKLINKRILFRRQIDPDWRGYYKVSRIYVRLLEVKKKQTADEFFWETAWD